MFDENDKQNLEIAKQLLSEALSFDVNDTNGYNATLFKLKQSLELLGTLRNKGNYQQNQLFKRTSYLRSSLVHGVALLDNPELQLKIKTFIQIYIPGLLNDLNNINALQQQTVTNLQNTLLYQAIATQHNDLAQTLPNDQNFQLYRQTFNNYVEVLKNIDLNTRDQSFQTRKVAALNSILTLGEITKQVLEHYPKGLEQLQHLPRIKIFSSNARNPLAHAQCNLELSDIKEIQDQLKQDLASTHVEHSQESLSKKLHELEREYKSRPATTSAHTSKRRKTSKEAEEASLLQQVMQEVEAEHGVQRNPVTPATLATQKKEEKKSFKKL